MAATVSEAAKRAELPDQQKLRWMYEQMMLIRTFEERIAALRQSGALQGSSHLYAGQEAVAVGICAGLNRDLTRRPNAERVVDAALATLRD